MDNLPDDERIWAARERALRAARVAADAEERLERHERVAASAARRLRDVLAWWWSERRTGGDRR